MRRQVAAILVLALALTSNAGASLDDTRNTTPAGAAAPSAVTQTAKSADGEAAQISDTGALGTTRPTPNPDTVQPVAANVSSQADATPSRPSATDDAPVVETPPATSQVPATDDDFDDYDYGVAQIEIWDPLEGYNRAMFKFNDGVYNHIARPVARTYEKIVPETPRRGISNFFENIRFPIRFVSNLAQGEFKQAGKEVGKFAVNTTAGILGVMKVSEKIKALEDGARPQSDTAQALGYWGMPRGFFFVVPVFGPTTVRDAAGWVGDYYLTPYNWQSVRDLEYVRWYWISGFSALNTVNSLPGILKAYDLAVKSAIDPYIAMRDGYVQYREAMIKKRPQYTRLPGIRRPGPRTHIIQVRLTTTPVKNKNNLASLNKLRMRNPKTN